MQLYFGRQVSHAGGAAWPACPAVLHPDRLYSLTHFAKTCKVVYRHYATLYFVFIVDEQESELGILDLVQGMPALRRMREMSGYPTLMRSVCGDPGHIF